MKIPTLIGLSILSLVLITGLTIQIMFQKQTQNEKERGLPQNLQQSNLSPNFVTFEWQTSQPVLETILYSPNSNFKDELTISDNQPTILHSLNLTNLQPNTTYYLKIQNKQISYQKEAIRFKTPLSQTSTFNFTPLIGSVVNQKLFPIRSSLVILEIDNVLPLSTLTDTKGNFILPVGTLYQADNLTPLNSNNLDGLLIISKDNLESKVNIHLPSSKVLPPIVLGQNFDYRNLSN